jgi:hypothetical protein
MKKKAKYTDLQRRALNRIIRFYRDRNSYDGVTSVRCTFNNEYESFVSVTVETRRSDCDKYSPRAVICAQRAHIMVTRRGKITVHSADSGLTDERKHVARMINGHVGRY